MAEYVHPGVAIREEVAGTAKTTVDKAGAFAKQAKKALGEPPFRTGLLYFEPEGDAAFGAEAKPLNLMVAKGESTGESGGKQV